VADLDLRNSVEAYLMTMDQDSVPVSDLVDLFGPDLVDALESLQQSYAGRGISLYVEEGRVSLRTVPGASGLLRRMREGVFRNPSSAVLETVSLVALYGPMTRSEIEACRGVRMSPGVLERAIEMNLIAPGPRRETPGRPMTWIVTDRIHDVFRIDAETLATFDSSRRSDMGEGE
jgi:segregation and condensation protein B